MLNAAFYSSPLGKIFLTADEVGLTGLWIEGQKGFVDSTNAAVADNENRFLKQARNWLDIYFDGNDPDFTPPLHLVGTDFQKTVWAILLTVPYGQTLTYGTIARRIAADRGRSRLSAQAVGGAVGSNPISVIVPCHRIVGANGNLTGYAGGIDKKVQLLTLEKVDMSRLWVPPSRAK